MNQFNYLNSLSENLIKNHKNSRKFLENKKQLLQNSLKNQKKYNYLFLSNSKPITKLDVYKKNGRERKQPLNYVYEMGVKLISLNVDPIMHISGTATQFNLNPASALDLKTVNYVSAEIVTLKTYKGIVVKPFKKIQPHYSLNLNNSPIFEYEMFSYFNPLLRLNESVESVESHLVDTVLSDDVVEKVKVMLESATTTFTNLNTIDVDSVNNLIKSMQGTSSSIGSFVEAPAESIIDSLMKTISKYFSFTPTTKTVLFFASLVSTLLFLHKSFQEGNHFKVQILLSLGVLVTTIPETIKTNILSVFTPLYQYINTSYEVLSPQMSEDSIQNLVTSFVIGMFGWNVKKTRKPIGEFIASYFSSSSRIHASLTEHITAMVKLIQNIVNYVLVHVFGKTTPLIFLNSLLPEMDDLLEEVVKFSNQLDLKEIHICKENHDKLNVYKKRARQLVMKIPNGTEGGKLRSILLRIDKTLGQIEKNFTGASFIGTGYRQEPVSILFKGLPQMGKSAVLEFLICLIGRKVFFGDELKRFINNPMEFCFSRTQEVVYWPGYSTSSFFCTIDDLFQAKDAVGNPDNEYILFIRMINIYQYLLHMADISEKSNTYFISKFVISTTNVEYFNPVSIVSKTAVLRRFHHIYRPKPKREYQNKNGTFDLTKYPDCKAFTPDMFVFTRIDAEGSAEYETIDIYDLVNIVVKDYFVKKLRHENKMEIMKKLLDSDYNTWEDLTYMNISPIEAFCRKNLEILQFPDYRQLTQQVLHDFARLLFPDVDDFDNINLDDCEEAFIKRIADTDFSEVWANHKSHPEIQALVAEAGLEMVVSNKSCWSNIMKCNIGEFYRIAVEFMNNNLLITIAGFALSSVLSYTAIKVVTKKKETIPIALQSDDSRFHRNCTSRMRLLKSKYSKLSLKPEMAHSYDRNSADIVEKIIRHNSYEFHLEEPEGYTASGFATFIIGTVFMIPIHFASRIMGLLEDNILKEENKIRLVKSIAYTNGRFNTIEFTLSEFCTWLIFDDDMASRDCAFVQLPAAYPAHKNIIKYYLLKEYYSTYGKYLARVVAPVAGSFKESMNIKCTMLSDSEPSIVQAKNKIDRIITEGFRYDGSSTGAGDCGALFTVMNRNPKLGTIGGYHVAGNSEIGLGISTFISREFLMEKIKLCPDIPISEDLMLDIAYQPEMGMIKSYTSIRHEIPSRFITELVLLKVSPKPFRSDIVRSVLYGMWDVKDVFRSVTAPAVLLPIIKNGVSLDPYLISRDKQMPPWVNINMTNLIINSDVLYDHLEHISPISVERRLLSFEEAILGLENDPDFHSICRQSSPGFPIVQDTSFPGKKKECLLGTNVEFDLTLPHLCRVRSRIEEVIKASLCHTRLFHANVDNLKDGRISYKKVQAALTRLFSCGSFDQLILIKMYTGSFSLWLHKNRIRNGSCIGMDPASTEWDLMAKDLMKFTPQEIRNMLAADYSSYDVNEKPVIQFEVLNIMNKWYRGSEEDDLVRKLIFIELANSKHVYDDVIYSTYGGLPSGHGLTPIINTIYNLLILRMAWCVVLNDISLVAARAYDDNVVAKVLGDDNLSAVHPNFIEIYNPRDVALAMLLVGQIMTGENKEVPTVELRHLSEVEFLKRSFRFEESTKQYVAPLRLDVVLEMPYWTDRSISKKDQITCDNIQTSLLELSLHPPDVFAFWAPKMLDAANAHLSYRPKMSSYHTCQNFMLKRTNYIA